MNVKMNKTPEAFMREVLVDVRNNNLAWLITTNLSSKRNIVAVNPSICTVQTVTLLFRFMF